MKCRLALLLMLAVTVACGDEDGARPTSADALSVDTASDTTPPGYGFDVVDTTDAPVQSDALFDPLACDLRWTYVRPEGGLPAPLALDGDGRIYAAGGGRLHRIGPAGTFDWVWPQAASDLATPTEQLGAPSVNVFDTTIFVGGESGHLYAVTHLGGTKWIYDAGSRIRTAPALAEPTIAGTGGTAVVAIVTEAGELHVLRDDGAQATLTAPPIAVGEATRPPGIGLLDDGAIITRTDRQLTGSNVQGALLWSQPADPGDELLAGPAFTSDGSVVVIIGREPDGGGSFGQIALATFETNGEPMLDLKLNLPHDAVAGIAFDDDDLLVLASTTRVSAWTLQGELAWRLLGTSATAPPTAAAGGLVVVPVSPNGLQVGGADGIHWRLALEGTLPAGAAVVAPDGTTYAHLGASIVAFHCGSTGPAASRWSRYQGNQRSNGRPAPEVP